MNSQKIKQLLAKEEGFKLDFKLKLSLEVESEKKEFVKDVIAIANTPGGRGYILFGVEDKTKSIIGIEDIPENIEEKVQQIIANRSTPPVPVKFDLEEIENKKIGILTIFKSMQVPHQMLQTGAFYVRRGSTTDKASRHEIANMLQQFGLLSFENVPCRQATLDALDFELIEKYIGSMQSYKKQDKLFLSTLGILSMDYERDCYYPTYGGLLLFGKNPQSFIVQAVLELQYKGGIQDITGNIPSMLENFEDKVTKLLPTTYPVNGLIEVVKNAIIHRDYWNNTQYIKVILENEKITVTNPIGYAYREGSLDQIRVNPWLYSRLLLIGQKENTLHFGIGLSKTKELFKEKGGILIQNNFFEKTFEVSLPGMDDYKK